MILDIRFKDAAPEQIQRVRMTTVYTQHDANASPEIIIHSMDYTSGPRAIPLSRIVSMIVTND